MALVAVKLLLSPFFVVGASVAARRFGMRVGGLLAGLPVVAGPIVLVYALQEGPAFAARAAGATLLGIVSLIGFVVLYARLARHMRWAPDMLAGWALFAAGTALFSLVSLPLAAALALSCAALALALLSLPPPHGVPAVVVRHPRWDLPLRALCAMALVLVLTAIAGWLGSRLSGLLAPFPVIATVLATFTHAQHGADQAVRLLRAMLTGYAAFVLFFFTLAVALVPLGTAAAFALATGSAMLLQLSLLALGSAERRLARGDSPAAPEGQLVAESRS